MAVGRMCGCVLYTEPLTRSIATRTAWACGCSIVRRASCQHCCPRVPRCACSFPRASDLPRVRWLLGSPNIPHAPGGANMPHALHCAVQDDKMVSCVGIADAEYKTTPSNFLKGCSWYVFSRHLAARCAPSQKPRLDSSPPPTTGPYCALSLPTFGNAIKVVRLAGLWQACMTACGYTIKVVRLAWRWQASQHWPRQPRLPAHARAIAVVAWSFLWHACLCLWCQPKGHRMGRAC